VVKIHLSGAGEGIARGCLQHLFLDKRVKLLLRSDAEEKKKGSLFLSSLRKEVGSINPRGKRLGESSLFFAK